MMTTALGFKIELKDVVKFVQTYGDAIPVVSNLLRKSVEFQNTERCRSSGRARRHWRS